MTMEAMDKYLESAGFDVIRTYISERKQYAFSITKGTQTYTDYFTYPGGVDNYRYINQIQTEFLNGLIEGFNKTYRDVVVTTADNKNDFNLRAYVFGEWGTTPPKKLKCLITKVIFNKPATIVFWSDGTKTVVKVQGKERFNKEKGLAMAIAKKALGNEGNYYNTFTKWLED